MSFFRQIAALTEMNIKSLPGRLGSSWVIVIGIAGVVGVLISVLGMATSLGDTVMRTGRPDRVIVLRGGANAEIQSSFSVAEALTIMDKPGVAHDADGDALGTLDFVRGVNLNKRADGTAAGLTVRGTSTQIFSMRPEIRLVEGRLFEPGLREVIVGRSAQEAFSGLEIGDSLVMQNADWRVVGSFVSGDVFESSILTDIDTLLSAYQRSVGSSITVLLESEEAFDAFSDAVSTDPTLAVDVMREPAFYARQSQQIRGLLTVVSYFVAGIMAVGALFAALNTMYSAVSSRNVEIATLRAIGFSASSVVVSVLLEALLLALVGAAIGATAAWLLFGGNTIAIFSNVFQLRITPGLIALGIVWAGAVGLLGGLFPAVRAARQQVATALRST